MENNNTEQFLKSLEASYLEGEYHEVLEGFNQIKDQLDPGFFHFNLGTTYARMGDFAMGRYHLERAQLEGFSSSDSVNNLTYVTETLSIEDLSLSQNFSDQAFNFLLTQHFSFFVFCTLVLLLVLLASNFFFKKHKIWLNGVLFIICILPLGFGQYLDRFETAIVLQDSQLREGPSEIYSDKGLLPAGAKVMLGREYNGWYFIERPNSLNGWIHEDIIGLIRQKD